MRFVYEERGRRGGEWRERFSATLVTLPCRKCGVPVTIGAPFCRFHLDACFGVKVQKEPRLGPSQRGLFATRSFRAGDYIVPYGGELVTNEELDERYGGHTAPYALELDDVHTQDAARLRSAGSLANHYEGLGRCPNAQFSARGPVMWLQACRGIAAGDAILVDYGEEYWCHDKGVRFRTEA